MSLATMTEFAKTFDQSTFAMVLLLTLLPRLMLLSIIMSTITSNSEDGILEQLLEKLDRNRNSGEPLLVAEELRMCLVRMQYDEEYDLSQEKHKREDG